MSTTDTTTQQGAALVLRGQGFIQQLIGQYGANARVVDVARSLLSQLGPQYQRALTQADRDQVAKDIAAREAQRATLVADLVKIDAAIAALDPLAANYATLLADLQTTRAGKVATVASLDVALAVDAGKLTSSSWQCPTPRAGPVVPAVCHIRAAPGGPLLEMIGPPRLDPYPSDQARPCPFCPSSYRTSITSTLDVAATQSTTRPECPHPGPSAPTRCGYAREETAK